MSNLQTAKMKVRNHLFSKPVLDSIWSEYGAVCKMLIYEGFGDCRIDDIYRITEKAYNEASAALEKKRKDSGLY